jgi:sugar O-acyltransferase (sialic acid O-acetyltransferase NeuD family)
MKKRLILLGGGGHCISCIDVIESESRHIIAGILDIKENVGKNVLGYPILGDDNDILKYVEDGCYFLLTIGQIKTADLRVKLFKEVLKHGGKFATVISNRAYIAKSASIGSGTIVMHDALINVNSHIGMNCIINTKALIEHDCEVMSHCHISTMAVLNGNVKVCERVFVGSGSVVIQGVEVPQMTFIKAGELVKHIV